MQIQKPEKTNMPAARVCKVQIQDTYNTGVREDMLGSKVKNEAAMTNIGVK